MPSADGTLTSWKSRSGKQPGRRRRPRKPRGRLFVLAGFFCILVVGALLAAILSEGGTKPTIAAGGSKAQGSTSSTVAAGDSKSHCITLGFSGGGLGDALDVLHHVRRLGFMAEGESGTPGRCGHGPHPTISL